MYPHLHWVSPFSEHQACSLTPIHRDPTQGWGLYDGSDCLYTFWPRCPGWNAWPIIYTNLPPFPQYLATPLLTNSIFIHKNPRRRILKHHEDQANTGTKMEPKMQETSTAWKPDPGPTMEPAFPKNQPALPSNLNLFVCNVHVIMSTDSVVV